MIRVLTETYDMCALAKNQEWRQLWWDGTSRRTVSMTAFAAGMLKNDGIKPIILQAAKVGCGEKSDVAVNVMQEILEDGK